MTGRWADDNVDECVDGTGDDCGNDKHDEKGPGSLAELYTTVPPADRRGLTVTFFCSMFADKKESLLV